MMTAFYIASALFFLLIAVAGAFMRATFVWPSLLGPYDFKNLVHAHSHVAYFGWSTLALMALMYKMVYDTGESPEGERTAAALTSWHLVPAIVASLGAFYTFATTGYSGISIFLSAVNALIWYVFIVLYLRGPSRKAVGRTLEGRYVLAAIFYLLIASVATWGASIWAMTNIGGKFFRELLISSFVFDFAYGWYTMGLLGVMLHTFKRLGGAGEPDWTQPFRTHLPVLAVFTLPASLNALPPEMRSHVPAALWLLASASGLMIGASYLLLARALWTAPVRRLLPPTAGVLMNTSILFLAVKGLGQPLRSLPAFAYLMNNHPLVIGDLHSTLLGFVSTGLAAMLILNTAKGGLAALKEVPDHTAPMTAFLTACIAGMVLALYATGLGILTSNGYVLAFLFSAALPLLPLVLLHHLRLITRGDAAKAEGVQGANP